MLILLFSFHCSGAGIISLLQPCVPWDEFLGKADEAPGAPRKGSLSSAPGHTLLLKSGPKFFPPLPFPWAPGASRDEAVPTCLLGGAFPAAQQEIKARRGGVISFISFFISSLLRVAGTDVQCICHLIVLPMKMCVHSTDTGENSTLYTFEGIQRSVTEKKNGTRTRPKCYWMGIYTGMMHIDIYIYMYTYIYSHIYYI